ncbi:MAG: alpha/beta hydrolase [Bacteroidales bacterium]|nr:alpha/beta hydrolase [Bacteroidales bacterium]
MSYKTDILKNEFESLTISQPDDYEGKVVCTLVRKPAPEKSVKAVLHVHGFNDYFFNTDLARKFNTQGFNFYALDLRKCGRSWLPHQKFNNVRNLDEYYQDIDATLNIIRSEGNEKILLSGHSMGGLIMLLYAEKNQDKGLFDALFLNSPFFEQNKDIVTKKLVIPVVARLGKIWPDANVPGRFSKFYGPSLHKNDYGEWDYDLNLKPHIMPLANMGWVRAIHQGQKKVWKGIELRKPLLIIHPAKSASGSKWNEKFKHADLVVNVKDISRHAGKIQGNCKIISIDGAVHDVMLSSKPVREKAYRELFSWLKILHF